VILRSEGKGDAGSSCALPVSPAPAEPALEALVRSHAHTRTREAAPYDADDALIGLTDSKDLRAGPSEMKVSANDEPDTAVSLRRCQVQCDSTADISMQTVETCE